MSSSISFLQSVLYVNGQQFFLDMNLLNFSSLKIDFGYWVLICIGHRTQGILKDHTRPSNSLFTMLPTIKIVIFLRSKWVYNLHFIVQSCVGEWQIN